MGQKTNSNILRLGINNNDWKSRYYNKTPEESSFLIFQDLQIQTYIKKLLISQGLIFHDYKVFINNNDINIYISYYNEMKSFLLINKTNDNQKLKLKKKAHSNRQKLRKYKTNNISFLKQNHFLKNSKYQKRNTLLKKYKTKAIKSKYINRTSVQKNVFIEQLLEGLNVFTQKKYNIYIALQSLNSNLNINLEKNEQKLWRKKLLMVKRYSKSDVFKKTINILLIIITCRNSAQLLADFIAKQFSLLKRHSYFLTFLKKSLNLFLKIPQAKISGIKIIIKGRFNGAPRARNQIISVGSIPVQSLNTNIDYYQSTAFSPNGTFGIKVWISEKY